MKKAIILILTFFSVTIYAQDCSCEANFKWVKETFENNDAGFAYALGVKGKGAYEKHNEVYLEKVKSISDKFECSMAMYEWLQFFRSGHISMNVVNQNASNQNSSKERSDEEIRESYKNSERLDIDLKEFKTYLASKSKPDYEGIWVSEPYKMGVKKVNDDYIGFIIEADGVYWTKGQVKFKIHKDGSAVFYMRDHSEVKFNTSESLGDNYLLMGFIDLKRTYPNYKDDPKVENYFEIIGANQPYYKKIDDNTAYIRIPSFNGANKKVIDSVILANKDEILKTENFIIDIRNNGGGSDSSYEELLPILYTNPIRGVGVEYYSTELNNQRMLDFINDPKYGFDEEDKKWAKESYDKLTTKIGEFVNLNEHVISENTYEEIHPYPKNIAVIINENNGSTAEQFLLEAKQSKKVKLYGTTTVGVLDISNMYFVRTPCDDFELGYCLTRSMRIPDMAIDDKGIQPDFYIDKSIPKYGWLDFVIQSLK